MSDFNRHGHAQAIRDAAAEVLGSGLSTAAAVALIGRLYTIAEAVERDEPVARTMRNRAGIVGAHLPPIEYLQLVSTTEPPR